MNRSFLSSLVLLALTACDGSYTAFTRDGGDGGAQDGSRDAGPPSQVVAMCPSTNVLALRETTTGMRVTPSATGVARLCDLAGPSGQQAYLALDARAGEHWHVHASAVGGAEPRLAVLGASCDPLACHALSSFCSGGSDEHLDFVPEADGRYWVVVEDEASTGTELSVEVFRSVCGDDVLTHGEGCDDGNTADGDGCDRRCRRELLDHELEPNDSPIGANALRPVGGSITVTGSLGGLGACTYPDVFVVEQTGTLRVRLQPTDGECIAGSNDPLRVRVRDATGSVLRDEAVDLSDCATLELTDLADGDVFVELQTVERPIPLEYDLTVEVP